MFKLLGTSDDVTTCDCCGKRGLKMTVALDRDGEVVHFGRDCAGAALYGRKSAGNTDRVKFWAGWIAYARRTIAAGTDAAFAAAEDRLSRAGIEAARCGDELMVRTPQGWTAVAA